MPPPCMSTRMSLFFRLKNLCRCVQNNGLIRRQRYHSVAMTSAEELQTCYLCKETMPASKFCEHLVTNTARHTLAMNNGMAEMMARLGAAEHQIALVKAENQQLLQGIVSVKESCKLQIAAVEKGLRAALVKSDAAIVVLRQENEALKNDVALLKALESQRLGLRPHVLLQQAAPAALPATPHIMTRPPVRPATGARAGAGAGAGASKDTMR